MNSSLSKINSFFSSEYANRNAIKYNFLSLLLYKFAYPTARMFSRYSISPNSITWLSFFFTCVAACLLFIENGPFYFVIFWVISLHLDFTDGTLARMTKKVSKSALRLDHMTDLVKLFIVFISLGIYYDTSIMWQLISFSVFTLLYSEILSHEVKNYLKRTCENDLEFSEATLIQSKPLLFLVNRINKNIINILRHINSIFFGISGHSLIFFCFTPFNIIYCNYFLLYFNIICIYGIIRSVISLRSFKR